MSSIKAPRRRPSLEGSTGMGFQGSYPRHVNRALRDRQVVAALQIDPKSVAIAEQLAEPHRHLSGHRLLLVQDVVERLPGYPKSIGNGRLAHRKRR